MSRCETRGKFGEHGSKKGVRVAQDAVVERNSSLLRLENCAKAGLLCHCGFYTIKCFIKHRTKALYLLLLLLFYLYYFIFKIVLINFFQRSTTPAEID